MLDKPPSGYWDAALVGKRLVEAFVTLDRMPGVRGPRGPGGHWPATIIEWQDQLAQAELEESERMSRQRETNRVVIVPSPSEITNMELAFEWLRELRNADASLALIVTFWALRTARGKSIKKLCTEKHWSPHKFFRQRLKGLMWIATMLNALRMAR